MLKLVQHDIKNSIITQNGHSIRLSIKIETTYILNVGRFLFGRYPRFLGSRFQLYLFCIIFNVVKRIFRNKKGCRFNR